MILIACHLSVSLIPFWNCLHFFDRSLSLENDFWSFTFCRLLPRWGRGFCLKSHELPFCWHITHEDFLGLILRNSFYALLCRWPVCTTLLNFNFSTFIALPILIASPLGKLLPILGIVLSAVMRYTVKRWSFHGTCLIFVYIIAVSAGVISSGFLLSFFKFLLEATFSLHSGLTTLSNFVPDVSLYS